MRPSLKITSSEPSIPRRFARAHSLDGFVRAASQRSEFMKAPMLVAAVLVLGGTTMFARTTAQGGNTQPSAPATAPASSPNQNSQNQNSQSQDNAPAAQPSTTTSASGQAAAAGAAPLRVMVGKSLLINTTERLKRV